MKTIFKPKDEEKLVNISFNIHKFSKKEKPIEEKDIVIISCFSEFGCEVMGAMYNIPQIISENSDKYYIVMGWYGRSYLYQHLVDEFWEIKEEFQWLRDYALAFHNKSKNLNRLEKEVTRYGKVINFDKIGGIAVKNECLECSYFWRYAQNVKDCPQCKSLNVRKALFSDIDNYKKQAIKIPFPSLEKLNVTKEFLGKNPVGITARNRKTYGRNLQIEFYEKLIYLLKDLGYNPIWLGEKQSTFPCPVKDVVDFSRKEESRDLEFTLAIVKQCLFTIQFWTASTRLAGIMGTPYLLFESPDQLFGNGQEAFRLALCTFGKRKIALCHYLNLYNDNATGLKLVKRCIEEMNSNNWNDVIGMVDEPEYVAALRQGNLYRFGKE